ncbi:hypothetical protein H160_03924 [Pseudomonas sp. LAMO17WK12:I9]|nr:hypothetical protein H160_03924 [Pseudomonas sp. LAMO17WK12:I9]
MSKRLALGPRSRVAPKDINGKATVGLCKKKEFTGPPSVGRMLSRGPSKGPCGKQNFTCELIHSFPKL